MLDKSYSNFVAPYDWEWTCHGCSHEDFSSKEEAIQHWILCHHDREVTEEERESIKGTISEFKTLRFTPMTILK